ncbi:MAG: hypothetical protein SGARI_005264 [Bacillariaceae sp.]
MCFVPFVLFTLFRVLFFSLDFALGRGSTRLAGTGRTAGIKARKLEQQGVAGSANAAKDILVGAAAQKRGAGGEGNLSDLTFLKNALGNEIAFAVEKGGGARANLLSQRHPNPNRKRQKLMDSAATRVATTIRAEIKYQQKHKEEIEKAKKEKEENGGGSEDKSKIKKDGTENMDWLNNNISREGLDMEMDRLRQQDMQEDDVGNDVDHLHLGDHYHDSEEILLNEDDMMVAALDENTRKAAFQAQYAKEMARQAELLKLDNDVTALTSPTNRGNYISQDEDDDLITWEDA